ncbi:hypothetical protein [Mycolicibacterium palauense]|uniref:hypothetical protein n=1 Tax=Mycolicibacterium palauense TaxID=2034511 RepID=UPI000BFEC3C2|nr:hypothetical protein [Mycolicibacterium palauense]
MTALRVALIVAGVALGAYGASLVLDFRPRTIVLIAVWAGVGVVVHDFVFAPLSAALGWTARRVVRGRWWTPVTVAALCSAVLVLLAIPVYGRPGAKPDNATVVDRDYPLGLWVSLAVVWACVPAYYLITSWITSWADQRRGRVQ